MNQSQGNSDVERETERLDESNKKEEQRIRKQEAKAVQNLNLYFIFQAIILASSTSLASAASCDSWWIPIALSLLAALTNFVSFSGAMSKILKSREELDQKSSDLAFMKVHRVSRERVNEVVPGAALNHDGREIVRPKGGGPLKKWKRRLVVWLCIGLFAGFSGVVMYGCHRILCHPTHRKCVDLC